MGTEIPVNLFYGLLISMWQIFKAFLRQYANGNNATDQYSVLIEMPLLCGGSVMSGPRYWAEIPYGIVSMDMKTPADILRV